MPHNLYIHSNLVCEGLNADELKQNNTQEQATLFRKPSLTTFNKEKNKQASLRVIETILALTCAVLVNSGILIVAASAFHENGMTEVAEISDAYVLLAQYLGQPYAVVFAVALLLCAQSSTVTSTIAGQVSFNIYIHI